MDQFEFWSSIVASLAWPICAVIIASIFRKKLSDLLATILKIELPGGISAEFGKGVSQVKEVAIEEVGANAVQVPEIPVSANVERVVNDASGKAAEIPTKQEAAPDPAVRLSGEARKIFRLHGDANPFTRSIDFDRAFVDIDETNAHPTGAVMAAWKELESTIFSLASASQHSGKIEEFNPYNVSGIVSALKEGGVLNEKEESAIQELRRLRNLAAHSTESINPADARMFVSKARSLRLALLYKGMMN
jgi:hypothetical protein